MKSSRTIHTRATTTDAAHTKSHAAESEVVAVEAPASVAAPPATASPASTPSAVFITPPPSTPMPVRPVGWTPRPGEDYRGTQPKSGELATLAAAIGDLKRFAAEYASILGTTAPPLDHVLQLFEAGNAWSASRVATASWDVYARANEGLSWGGIRDVMDTLRPAFDLAARRNASLTTQLPGLASLLGVQKLIARKGASTRRANKADEAEGKLATHGKVGKATKKAAANAALAASTQAAAATPAQTVTTATGGAAATQADAQTSTTAVPTTPTH